MEHWEWDITPTGMPQGDWFNFNSLPQLWTEQNLVVNHAQVNFLDKHLDPALGKGSHLHLPEKHTTTQSVWVSPGGSDETPSQPFHLAATINPRQHDEHEPRHGSHHRTCHHLFPSSTVGRDDGDPIHTSMFFPMETTPSCNYCRI